MSVYCLTHGIESVAVGGCVLPVWSDEEQRVVEFYYVPQGQAVSR